MTEIRIPDIGDAEHVEVIELCVAPGDRVAPDDAILVVESDKASMEIPAGVAGVLGALLVDIGDAVVEGQTIARLSEADAPSSADVAEAAPSGTAKAPSPLAAANRADLAPSPTALPAIAPGSDAAAFKPVSEEPRGRADATSIAPDERQAAPPLAPTPSPGAQSETSSLGAGLYAGPATRRLARELGVKLAEVRGSGARGRIVKDDVKRFVQRAMTASAGAEQPGSALPPAPVADYARFGPVESRPLSRVRAIGARNLRASWLNIPHVTHQDEVDVTAVEQLRRSLKEQAAERGIKLTPLPFIVMACCAALRAFPTFNASLDAAAENFLLKRYYNIGLAVDTDQGLVVPVLKDAERKGIWELAAAIADLADRVRNRRLRVDDTLGGTFSVSSLGGLGGTGFTPIVNAPEVAILGVARLVTRPLWDGIGFRPRQLLPLSLSYDHRAINGAEAGRFLSFLADHLNGIGYLDL